VSRHPGWFTDRGLFLALEGGEGAGKSTQACRLTDWLRGAGHDVLLTREPGGTSVGGSLRGIVLDPATGDLSPRTEALIYAADKAEHVDAVVVPSLERRLVDTKVSQLRRAAPSLARQLPADRFRHPLDDLMAG